MQHVSTCRNQRTLPTAADQCAHHICHEVTKLDMLGVMVQAESVGDLEHGSEHSSFPMAPADARPPTITRSAVPSSSHPPPAAGQPICANAGSWLSSAESLSL